MSAQDGRYVVVFNGEVYNYQALWKRHGTHLGTLRSGTDTEVVLRLYADQGPGVLRHLRGMYALAIWDGAQRELFMARDPFGMKPLYYADDGRTVRFASQVQALLAGGECDTAPEPAGHAGFFLWGFVPEPYTMFRGIRAVPAGSWVTVRPNGVDGPHRSVTIRELFAGAGPVPPRPAQPPVAAALRDTVRHHLVADVDVGVFLSGGIDSATIATAATELGSALTSVSLGVAERRGGPLDETPIAEEVARRLGTDHHTVWFGQRDFEAARRSVLSAMDQPTTDGVNTYLVSSAAASVGLKTVMSGIGADELYGSYPGFGWVRRIAQAPGRLPVPPAAGRLVRRALVPVLGKGRLSKAAGLLEHGTDLPGAYLLRRGLFMPWELPGLIGRDLAEAGWAALHELSPLRDAIDGVRPNLRVPSLEVSWYLRGQLLRDADWASMAHSLEVRLPLVDAAFYRAVLPSLRPDTAKTDLALAPRRPVPRSVLAPSKLGFTVPLREWAGVTEYRGLRGWARHVYRRYLQKTAG